MDEQSENRNLSASSEDDNLVRMRILHLSDLHFGTKEDAQLWYGQLADDLKQELNCNRLDAIIISGDVANLAVADEYDAAKVFINKVCSEFGVDRSNLVIVPGNHDLNWKRSKQGYTLVDKEDLEESVSKGRYIEVSDEVIRLRDDETYQRRFEDFARFYNDVTISPYPLDFAQQGKIHHLQDLNLLIMGLNSAWQVDHHFTTRADICADALTLALDTIRKNPDLDDCLKFAVWHHPLHSPFEDRITDHGFMERLALRGFSVCFHGHLHKATSDLFRYDHSARGRKIEIVGAGTFGAPIKEWYPGYPLQYNLLKVCQREIIVETRRRTEINGAWKPDAIWTQGPDQDPLPRYFVKLPSLEQPVQGSKQQAHKLTPEPGVYLETSKNPTVLAQLVSMLRKTINYVKEHPLLSITSFFVAVVAALSTFLDLPQKLCQYSDGRLAPTTIEQRLSKLWTDIEREEIEKIFGEPAFIRTYKEQQVLFYRGINSLIAIGMTPDKYVGNFTIAALSNQFTGYALPNPEIYGEFIFGEQNMLKFVDDILTVYVQARIFSKGEYIEFSINPLYIERKMGYWHTITLKAFSGEPEWRMQFGETNLEFWVLDGLEICEEQPSNSECEKARKEIFQSVPGWLEISLDSDCPDASWILSYFKDLDSLSLPSNDLLDRMCLFFGL